MKKRSIFPLLFFAIVFFSCNNKKTFTQKSFSILNVEDALENSQPFNVENAFKHIEFIPLETNDNILLDEVSKIIKAGHFFYISDISGNLYKFNSLGKFVKKIGNKGNGPKEFTVIADFIIDEINDFVLINSYGKLIIYSTDGEYIKSYNIDNNNQVMVMDKKGRLYFIMPDVAQPKEINSADIIKITSLNGDSIKYFKTVNIRHSGLSYFNSIYIKNEIVYYKEELGKTIYKINTQLEKDSIFKLNLGKYAFQSNDFNYSAMQKWESLFRLDKILISNNIVFLNFQKGLIDKNIYPLIFNGKNLIFPHSPKNSSNKGIFYNEIKITPFSEYNNEIICVASVMDIIKRKKLNINKFKDITELSNPVLCILK